MRFWEVAMSARRSVELDEGGTPLELCSAGDVETLVRAHGTRFVVTNRFGDIAPRGARELGLFADDTRYLSHYELSIEGGALIHLSSSTFDAALNQIDHMVSGSGILLDDPENFLHVQRRQLVDTAFCEELRLVNYVQQVVEVDLRLTFAADFADVFEVRGAQRRRRGTALPPVSDGDTVILDYVGVDQKTYRTTIRVEPKPDRIAGQSVTFHLALKPGETRTILFRAEPSIAATPPKTLAPAPTFGERALAMRRRAEEFFDESTRFVSDNAAISNVLEQSATDLQALTVDVRGQAVLAAGIPWFCCPFGRDTLIASYEALMLNPSLAASSLRALAALQGTKFDEFTEEEPGKIFHELRFGEMTANRETPHSPYYGSVDSTPLFVVVADAAYRVTADEGLLRDLRPALISALEWIDRRSEGATHLVTYARQSARGLDNQGWKDSRTGVPFPDGHLAEPPIALCEVQGYCADAFMRGARMMSALGDETLARCYHERAIAMTALIERRFWLPEEHRYAYAIDGKGRALPTVVSNLGHLLWSRVPSSERAVATGDLLVAPESLSHFGIRTLAAGQRAYNPLSYHNGTVWPHDNALVAKGFANYGLMGHARRVFEATARAMHHFRDRRLPELFCGTSSSHETLVRYPVACSPQAWAAAAPFLMLQAMLGIHIDGPGRRLAIRNPQMPAFMKRLDIDRLRVGRSRISLRIRRVGKRCHVDRLDVTGEPLRSQVDFE
jgi:glycogen debranching enzyme